MTQASRPNYAVQLSLPNYSSCFGLSGVGVSTARDILFTFPAELSKAGRFNSAMKIAQYLADNYLVGVDFNIHEPGKDGDERNYHCHMLTTTRRMTADGFGEKARELDDGTTGPAHAKKRAFIAQTLNDELKAEGRADAVHVEHRSFKARGSAQVPTRHMGQHEHIKRQQRNRATRAWTAQQRKDQKERHGKEHKSRYMGRAVSTCFTSIY
jgi:hypothetical protein